MAVPKFWKPGDSRPAVSADLDSGSGRDVCGDGRAEGKKKRKDRLAGRVKGKGSGKGKREGRGRGDRNEKGDDKGKGNGKGKGKAVEMARKKDRRYSDPVSSRGEERSQGPMPLSAERDRKTSPTNPSQTLLAMKFMQRRVKLDEAQQQQENKRRKLEREFNSTWARKLRDGGKEQRLVSRPEEVDPARMLLGRRSFGGFNAVVEDSYGRCVEEVYAGSGGGRGGEEEGSDGEGGVSDKEMAERLGGHIQQSN